MSRLVVFAVLLCSAGAGVLAQSTSSGFVYPTPTASPSIFSAAFFGATPADGYFASRWHCAADIRASVGTSVRAIADGDVDHVSTGGWGDGNVGLVVKHRCSDGRSFLAVYGHVRNWSTGHVTAGSQIGTVGPWSNGNHLHFGIYDAADGGGGWPYLDAAAGYGWGMRPMPRPAGSVIGGVLAYDRWFDPIEYIRQRSPWGGGHTHTKPDRPSLTAPSEGQHYRVGDRVHLEWNASANDNDQRRFVYQCILWGYEGGEHVVARIPDTPTHAFSADWIVTYPGEYKPAVEVWCCEDRWRAGDSAYFNGSDKRTITVEPALFSAKLISQNGPSFDVPMGQSQQFVASYQNTGTWTWRRDKVSLGTYDPKDHIPQYIREDVPGGSPSGWLANNRINLVEDEVPPGGIGHFQAWGTPEWSAAPRDFVDRFAPVADDQCDGQPHGWMDLPGNIVTWTIHGKDRRDAYTMSWAGQTPLNGQTFYQGQIIPMHMAWRNTGTATWYKEGRYHLRAGVEVDKHDGNWVNNDSATFEAYSGMLSPTRVTLQEASVPPGGVGEWKWEIRVPTTMSVGVHRYYVGFVSDGGDGLDFWRDEWWHTSWWEFNIAADTRPPNPATISFSSQRVTLGTPISLNVSATDGESGVQRGRIAINQATDGSESGAWWYAELPNFRGTASYTWDTTGWAPGVHVVRLDTWDGAGNFQNGPAYSCTLLTAVPAPTVVSGSPTGSGVSVSSSVVVTFSTAMNQAATWSAFSMTPNTNVTHSWSADGKTLTVRPTSALSYDTNYQVTVSTGARSQAGQGLASPSSWQFHTETSTGEQFGQSFGPGTWLIGLPARPLTADAAAALGTSKVAQWNAAGQTYSYYATSPFSLAWGAGYWIQCPSNHTVSFRGVRHTAASQCSLQRGWNLLGNPYSNNLTLGQLGGGGNLEPFAWRQNAAGTGYELVSGINALNAQREVQPWRGMWVYAKTACQVTLGTTATSEAPPTTEEVAWALRLQACAGHATDTDNYLGATRTATALRASNPPVAGEGYVDLYMVDAAGASRAVDLRAAAEPKCWEVVVETDLAGAEVKVSFPDLSQVPADQSLRLTDLDTGRTVNMRTATSYCFTAGDGLTRRHLRITAQPRQAQAALVTAATAQALRSGGLTVTYALSAPAQVGLEVRNIAGRSIAQVPEQYHIAGTHTALWSGRSATGSKAPAGQYLLTLRCLSEDGTQTNRTLSVRMH